MFHRVRDSRKIFKVTEIPHVYIHRRRGLICFDIMDKQHLELIGQSDDSVGSVVQRRLFEMVCEPLDGAATMFAQGVL